MEYVNSVVPELDVSLDVNPVAAVVAEPQAVEAARNITFDDANARFVPPTFKVKVEEPVTETDWVFVTVTSLPPEGVTFIDVATDAVNVPRSMLWSSSSAQGTSPPVLSRFRFRHKQTRYVPLLETVILHLRLVVVPV